MLISKWSVKKSIFLRSEKLWSGFKQVGFSCMCAWTQNNFPRKSFLTSFLDNLQSLSSRGYLRTFPNLINFSLKYKKKIEVSVNLGLISRKNFLGCWNRSFLRNNLIFFFDNSLGNRNHVNKQPWSSAVPTIYNMPVFWKGPRCPFVSEGVYHRMPSQILAKWLSFPRKYL